MYFGGPKRIGSKPKFGPRGSGRPLNINVPRCKAFDPWPKRIKGPRSGCEPRRSRPTTNIDYGPRMKPFVKDVMRTVVRQPDYTGMGGHGLKNHGPHGPHRQTSIGLKTAKINFRQTRGPRIGPRPIRFKKF